MHKRLPRFRRASDVAFMQLEKRDCEIIKLVYRHRFLRSDQIIALVGGSRQQILRRLKLLFHHGYLDRPRAQLGTIHLGSQPIAYGLAKRGGALLNAEFGIVARPYLWSERNHVFGRVYLEHTLSVADVMVALDRSCRQHDVRLLYDDDLPIPRPFQWTVMVAGRVKIGVEPDRLVALEAPDVSGQMRRRHFFIEADCGTMPVVRKDFAQSSFFRKMTAYVAMWKQDLHRRKLGIHHFRVLTVTKSAMRVKSLVAACTRLGQGQGLFLFADTSILAGDVLTTPFHVGRAGETTTLLD